MPVLRWIGAAINTLMLVSIPVDGGHYFIDVLAGLAIAVVSRDYRAPRRIDSACPSAALTQAAAGQIGLVPGN